MRVNRQLILVALKGKADVTDFIFMIDTDLSPETVSVWTNSCHSLFISSAQALIQEHWLNSLFSHSSLALHSSSKTFNNLRKDKKQYHSKKKWERKCTRFIKAEICNQKGPKSTHLNRIQLSGWLVNQPITVHYFTFRSGRNLKWDTTQGIESLLDRDAA